MITTAEEYFANLFKIQESGNVPSLATLLPKSENIYNINLDSRTVEAPEFLSVTDDHDSETIYFMVDRFFDNMDMSTTSCVIQYINAKNEGRLYAVPYYDIETYHASNKMLIPWCIEGEATKAAGDVTYSIRFFQVDTTGKVLTYNLNTIPVTSKVLNGINVLGYNLVDVTEEQFYNRGNTVYYVKSGDAYVKAPDRYSPGTKYYTLTDGYDYGAEYLDAILHRLQRIEQDFHLYWYDQSNYNQY